MISNSARLSRLAGGTLFLSSAFLAPALAQGVSFTTPTDYVVGGSPNSNPQFVAVGDFNGDGVPDLATANFGAATVDATTVSVLLGNGNGTFQAPRILNAQRGPLWIAVADLNGDAIQDLVVANFSQGTVSVLLGNGDGNFQAARNRPANGAASVAVADFNGDGFPDLAV